MMTQALFSIREAAEVLGVETHALRYWEEELGLDIDRNSQGRRVYSEKDMDVFRQIMSWKEQGMQLRAIRLLLHPVELEEEINPAASRRIIMYRPRESAQGEAGMMSDQSPQQLISMEQIGQLDISERAEKSRRLQELLKQFIAESIRESNAELLQSMKEGMMKELDYQFRLQEEREAEREKLRIEKEDEHFRQLDENLRSAMEKRGRKGKRGAFR